MRSRSPRARSTATHEPFREQLGPARHGRRDRISKMPAGWRLSSSASPTSPSRSRAAEALKRANETLERRVEERTAELTASIAELGTRQGGSRRRQSRQDQVHRRGKPRHPAAAQCRAAVHLEPRRAQGARRADGELVRNIDASLEAVEDILSALLDISRLDAGVMQARMSASSASMTCSMR